MIAEVSAAAAEERGFFQETGGGFSDGANHMQGMWRTNQ